ncbi:leucyl/phenylalanyl-tRNA--protein transferase [Candidatus Uabimicrobium sp. HlEnr_7]|uniref:leucyl/phenylalanyl-tRNA--protein transferase n=1 Tax=Candidatus Uabimicrobium helgolandensis TaxID=3095367 RepID=UPI00355890D0
MVRYLLPNSSFPDPAEADENGLVAIGGRLTTRTLIEAYKKGIFPWFNYPPILWYSLCPRMVLLPQELYVGRTLRNSIRKQRFTITLDTSFRKVISSCARKKRPDQNGTWINKDMINAYSRLHTSGYAHSCEAWLDDKLVGGLYGISLGRAFYGESMFANESDASKIAFVYLVKQLQKWKFHIIDCQMETDHLTRFGAKLYKREIFQATLQKALQYTTKKEKWKFDDDLQIF